MKKISLLALVIVSIGSASCAVQADSKPTPGAKGISSFEECVAAGFPVARSYPPKCFIPGGMVFEQKIERKVGDSLCKDLCGDGVCQQMVCQAAGCPCAEDPESCQKDCAAVED